MPAAMIWGASGGIGRALVQQLSEHEWQKAAMRLPKDALQPDDVARQIHNAYAERHTGTLDL